MKRALHTLVMGLNFVHAGCRHVPLDALRRPPSQLHVSVYKRLGGFLRACRRQGATVPFCAGRRGAHLVARQNELLSFLAASGLGASGSDSLGVAAGSCPRVPHSDSGPDCLRPYQPLRAETIVLHGEANWDIAPYLGPGMLLAFKEPAVLETFGGTGGPAPTFEQEDPEELHKLMLVWDSKSLLHLRPRPVDRSSRVFGSFKSPESFAKSATAGGKTPTRLSLKVFRTSCPKASFSQGSGSRATATSSWGARRTGRTSTLSAVSLASAASATPFGPPSGCETLLARVLLRTTVLGLAGPPPVSLDFSPLPPPLLLGRLC